MQQPSILASFVIGISLIAPWQVSAQETGTDGKLIGWWRFDEGEGIFSASASNAAGDAELHNVEWVQGEFGTALRFTGTNSFVTLPSIPVLDGSDEMTISSWVYWEGTGKYPNILTGGVWSPGGFLLFVNEQTLAFRMGRPGHRAGVKGEQWKETSAPLLSRLPLNKWVHVTAVFDRPHITTYVNGERVGSAKWDYPIGHQGDLQLGRWSGAVSHTGLIDDVRIYKRALDAQEVRELAHRRDRISPDYVNLGPAKSIAKELKRLETRWAALVIGDDGSIMSLAEKESGRELMAEPQSIVTAQLASGRRLPARRMRFENGLFVAEFPRAAGTVTIQIQAKQHYFVFTPVAVDLEDVIRLSFCQISPSPDKYLGRMSGLASDDESGVCLRSLALEVETTVQSRPRRLSAATTREHGLVHHSIGLAAGPREHLITMLRSMAERESVPSSKVGGPWAMGAEATRGSYLFANLAAKDTDAWIDLARRGGFTNIHIHAWWTTLGHYVPRAAYFPNGLEDMKAAARRIRAAGLKPGFHTLTACISTADPWVTPVPSPHLIASNSYTLSKPLSAEATTVFVDELPAAGHDLVWSYSGNGNALRIGEELIRYAGISREVPYAFTGCERGAFKTRAASHASGVSVDYLQQRYLAFYPEPKSPLAAELADRIAKVYNDCELDMIYFDGSEGMRSRYGVDAMRWAIFQRLNGGVTEASQWGHNSWWFHSRLGAWDHPVWAMKDFHDEHVRVASQFRLAELLEPQMGWWAPRGPTSIARGHFPDEMEYFAGKNLAIDAPMSIQGVHATARPANARMEEQLTILGWYERLRLARYFDDNTLDRLCEPGSEFRLRQNATGTWQLTPVDLAKHRISALGNGSERWTSRNPYAAQPLRLRLEALYSVAPYDSQQAKDLADFASLDSLSIRREARGVTSQIATETSDVKAGASSLRLRATNSGVSSRGAWCQVGTSYPHPYFSMQPGDAMGVWVKGDGSGALLNIQIRSPREYHSCISDHYVDLDFTGWRYVELLLRERDSDRLTDYVWPYTASGGRHAVYRNSVDRAHVSEVSVWLNEIPAGGQVDILLSPIHALPSRKVKLTNPSLQVGGQSVTFPVTLESGQYIELENPNDCVLYDERGELLRRFRPRMTSIPTVASGDNSVRFDCEQPNTASARAEVTFVTLGPVFGDSRNSADINWAHLDREYDIPRVITRTDGVDNVWQTIRRAEESDLAPHLELDIQVEELAATQDAEDVTPQLDTPTLTIDGAPVRFPVCLAADQRLVCRDQRSWRVFDSAGNEMAAGELPDSFPELRPGANRVALTFKDERCASCRLVVKLVKVYGRGKALGRRL